MVSNETSSALNPEPGVDPDGARGHSRLAIARLKTAGVPVVPLLRRVGLTPEVIARPKRLHLSYPLHARPTSAWSQPGAWNDDCQRPKSQLSERLPSAERHLEHEWFAQPAKGQAPQSWWSDPSTKIRQ